MKNYRNFLGTLYFKLHDNNDLSLYDICIFQIFFFKFFFTTWEYLHIFASWGIFGLAGISKCFIPGVIRQEKLLKFTKILLSFHVWFSVQKFSSISNIFYSQKEFINFVLDILVTYVVLAEKINCFKYFQIYILGRTSKKNQTRKNLKYVKMNWNTQKISNVKSFQYSLIIYFKRITQYNRLYFFFLIFWHAKVSPSFKMPCYCN